ncbi:MAG: hypothetical protein HRF40_11435 [Nitrososphaera sp.]|jgi:hypothetical protein
MTQYDHDIDDAIISYLYKKEKANFSQLVQHVSRRMQRRISNKVLSNHLKRLKQERIIRRDEESAGVERFSYLTKLARQQLDLGIPVRVKTKSEQRIAALDRADIEDMADNRKRMYQLLFFIASSGAGRLKPSPKPEPGDIGVYGPDGKLMAYSYYDIPGVGASDFSVEPREIIGQAGALTHVSDLSQSEVAALFDMLLKENPPLIRPIDEVGGETRYGIADRLLSEYISDCWTLFPSVQSRLEETWQYVRKPENEEEIGWYVFFYGKRKAKSFFAKAQETRRYSKADSKIRKSFEKSIRDWDTAIQHRLYGWRDEKGTHHSGIYKKYGRTIMKKYKFPAQVLLEMIYPKFLKKLQKEKRI